MKMPGAFRWLVGAVVALVLALVVLPGLTGARQRAESLNCASSVVSICYAGRLWAEDHGGSFPTNFLCMSNELATLKVLSCSPARRARASEWSAFTPDNSTYEIV